jgi:hypothetical protein
MTRILLAFILFSSSAYADIALQFEQIRIAPLFRVILGDVARVPFALSSDSIADQSVITVQTDKLTKSGSVSWLRDVVQPYGFDVVERGGLYHVVKAQKPLDRGKRFSSIAPPIARWRTSWMSASPS